MHTKTGAFLERSYPLRLQIPHRCSDIKYTRKLLGADEYMLQIKAEQEKNPGVYCCTQNNVRDGPGRDNPRADVDRGLLVASHLVHR